MKTIDKITALLDSKEIPKHKRVSLLVEVTGKSWQAISKWFKGTTKKPDYENVKAIADYFSVDVESLLDEDAGAPMPSPKTEKLARISQLVKECADLGLEDLLLESLETFSKVAQPKK